MNELIQDLLERYPRLQSTCDALLAGYRLLESCYQRGGKVLIAGNGGSAADAEHIAGELMKGFCLRRPVPGEFAQRLMAVDPELGASLGENLEGALRAIPLTGHEALSTAYLNDKDPYGVFAQQLYGLADAGDVFLAISTSGNSRNVLNAAVVARAMGVRVLALTGMDGGALEKYADVAVKVPQTQTHQVQELHLPVYHCWCRMLEQHFFGNPE